MKKIDKKRFSENYLESAIVQKEIVSRLMERLSLKTNNSVAFSVVVVTKIAERKNFFIFIKINFIQK